MGLYASWIIFHLRKCYITWDSFEDFKTNSIYYEQSQDGQIRFSITRFLVPIRRGCILTACLSMLVLTYQVATKGKINHGIISSIFSTSLVYSSVWFWIVHKQKLNRSQICGITLVILCVVLISLGGGEDKQKDKAVKKDKLTEKPDRA